MAQEGEVPRTPIPQSEAPAPSEPTSMKRPRDDDGGVIASATGEVADDHRSPKRRAKNQDVLFRIVVPSRQIGKVIGKEGSRIQKIREETKATIKIADAIARHEERVIIISSKDSENVISDAENALLQIASLILKGNTWQKHLEALKKKKKKFTARYSRGALWLLCLLCLWIEEDDSNTDALKVGVGHVVANAIRLLIAGSQAGCLIGMSGQNIEKLRNSSGATITILPQNQLPLCASAHDSDRMVQISGDVPAVLKALEEIGCQLRTTNLAADYVTLNMMIPETLVGGLIGRCGSNISRIRNESGAMIKVCYGGKGEQNHRQIQFGGSAQQVALAKQRVDEYIYSQLMQQAGAQHSV
ncbi:KH domain-containing protein HEN4 [Vitis vinifera]|uniref:KH domain-containing protein HEN4 n=1 Tax=Vitis vinifera TaxID=29760 RepID=A0A438HJ17_VITVI|nr:KH domain-containing protein HEN4 [Vitis vinifera]